MARRTELRLKDIRKATNDIKSLLANVTFDELKYQRHTIAALERYLEIISEASRHVPEPLKEDHGAGIQWRKMADLGNLLRHTYHRADLGTLWDIYREDIPVLEVTVDAMLDATNPTRDET